GVHADENVHPVTILPQLPDLHFKQVARRAEGVYDLFSDQGVPRLPLVLLDVSVFFALLRRRHRNPPRLARACPLATASQAAVFPRVSPRSRMPGRVRLSCSLAVVITLRVMETAPRA